jgi:hypothetical protein
MKRTPFIFGVPVVFSVFCSVVLVVLAVVIVVVVSHLDKSCCSQTSEKRKLRS